MEMDVDIVRVRMHVRVKCATAPPDEQPDGESGDEEADGRLGGALQSVWEVSPVEDDGDAERKERQRVPDSPRQSESGCIGGPALPRREQGRDGRQVVRIGSVAQSEQDRNADDESERRAVGE
jgi:hypothetical protein